MNLRSVGCLSAWRQARKVSNINFLFLLNVSMLYITAVLNLATFTASLVAVIKFSSVQVFGHAGYDVCWTISVGTTVAIFAIVGMNGFANRRMVPTRRLLPNMRQRYREYEYVRHTERLLLCTKLKLIIFFNNWSVVTLTCTRRLYHSP